MPLVRVTIMRITFTATMALSNGADIITVANLLGRANLSHVTKYAKVTDTLKLKAVHALPQLYL